MNTGHLKEGQYFQVPFLFVISFLKKPLAPIFKECRKLQNLVSENLIVPRDTNTVFTLAHMACLFRDCQIKVVGTVAFLKKGSQLIQEGIHNEVAFALFKVPRCVCVCV